MNTSIPILKTKIVYFFYCEQIVFMNEINFF